MKYVVAACSTVVWGSGQFINKQKMKGLILFIIQVCVVFLELSTGTLDILTGKVEAQFRNAGFFTKGIWGLITLGTLPRTNSRAKVYDHSIMLMIAGIIAVITLIIILFFYVWNIIDAFRTRVKIEQNQIVTSKAYFKNLWNDSFEYIVISPAFLLILFVSVIPILFSFVVVFTNYNANCIPPKNLVSWTGFKTFSDIIKIPVWSKTFGAIFVWTVIWAFITSLSTYFLGFIQALLINKKSIKLKKLWRGLLILPWAIPGLVSIMVLRTMLSQDGEINNLLISMGIITQKIPFLSDAMWARTCAILVNLWIGFPYFMSLISSILTTVSEELYEASSLDGANALEQFIYITLPVVFQSTAPLLIFSITYNFNNFGLIYFLTEGGPLNPNYQMAGSTDILITWIFKLTLDQRMYNYAAAMSIFIFFIIASVSVINLMKTKSFRED